MKKILKNKYFIAGMILVLLLFATFLIFLQYSKKSQTPNQPNPPSEGQSQKSPEPAPPSTPVTKPALKELISNSKSRITKKPFGIYITPQNSPVQPEKFTGYHTGTDFETTPTETSADVAVSTICSGKIRVKQIVSGYGGVIVQDCTIEGQTVTILYGHIDIRPDYVAQVGQEVVEGTKLAMLAPANSEYSGGERKHLHLGIHNGSEVEYRGYVQSQSELSSWLDANKYL